jgi:hypothetical protein
MSKFQEETLVGKRTSVGSDDTVFLHNRFGNIVVEGRAGTEADIKAEMIAGGDSRKDARDCMHQMALAIERQGRRLDISVNCPEKGNATEFQSNLNLNLPACALLRIENTYGDVLVDGIPNAVLVHNRFGSASLHNCRSADITNAFGDVNVTGLSRRVAVDGRFGNVNARDLQGDIHISNENGILRISGSTGRFELENTLGDLNISSCRGRFKITGNRGNVTFDQSAANPDTVLALCRNGGIQLCLPACPSARINARAARGKVNSQLPGAKPVGSGEEEQSLVCTTGQGLASFELETFGGDISIRTAP